MILEPIEAVVKLAEILVEVPLKKRDRDLADAALESLRQVCEKTENLEAMIRSKLQPNPNTNSDDNPRRPRTENPGGHEANQQPGRTTPFATQPATSVTGYTQEGRS